MNRAIAQTLAAFLTAARYTVIAAFSAWWLPGFGQPSSTKNADSEAWFVRKDSSWVDKLSRPKYEIAFTHDIRVTMRDGVKLSANIWRPKAEGKFPVIFTYNPYDNSAAGTIALAKYFVPRGYVFASIDVRGRHDSEGESYLYWKPDWRNGKFDGLDVYDCQTWLGEQPWSTGKIGMTGGSYLGFVQWMGAPLGNKYLTCLVPYTSPDDHHDNVYPGGALQHENSLRLLAILGNHTHTNTNQTNLRENYWDWNKLLWHLPLRTLDEAVFGQKDILWQDLMDHPDNDEYWRFSVGERPRAGEMSVGKYPQVKVPALNITGWYDQVSQATINNYLGMVRYGPAALRSKQHLVVGPWRHGTGPRLVGDLDYGADAEVDFRPIELRWYDYWLKGIENGVMDEPPVNIFVMGKNHWRSVPKWPLSEARETKYYLHSAGRANSGSGDGTLNATAPANEPTDGFVYDPANPVPGYGGHLFRNQGGPRDQRKIQVREDVLVYTGEVLGKDIEVTGRLLAKVYAATSARDTDFTAKLVDVHPNGYAQILAEGIIRGRYRNSFKRQELIVPGEINEYTIDLWSISHVFLAGHRIQVEISSSNFPKYDRNPNTGHKFGEDAELQKATQTIYHNTRHPSHIILPVMP